MTNPCARFWSGLFNGHKGAAPAASTKPIASAANDIVVKAGDTLAALARTHEIDLSAAQIIRNSQVFDIGGTGGIDPNQIQPGDRIRPNDVSSGAVGDTTAQAADIKGSPGDVGDDRGRCCPPPPWMPIAWTEQGKDVRENLPGHHPDILKYHAITATKPTSENTSWCGSFVGWVLKQAGYKLTTVPERALTWGRASNHAEGWWPTGVNIGRPIYGAIATKSRKGGGHVTFVVGKDPNDDAYLYCLGGNQSNALNVSRYKKSVFSSFFVPEGYEHSCCELPDYTGKAAEAGSEA